MRRQLYSRSQFCGFPTRIEHVQQAAELIIRVAGGENWITQIFKQHPKLAKRLPTPLERGRVDAENPSIIRDNFATMHQ